MFNNTQICSNIFIDSCTYAIFCDDSNGGKLSISKEKLLAACCFFLLRSFIDFFERFVVLTRACLIFCLRRTLLYLIAFVIACLNFAEPYSSNESICCWRTQEKVWNESFSMSLWSRLRSEIIGISARQQVRVSGLVRAHSRKSSDPRMVCGNYSIRFFKSR